jgi:site-specific DNA recombinase
MKPKRAALYCRVSTTDQNADLQQTELCEYCQFRTWEIVEVFTDRMSGSKDRRPALDTMLTDARRGRFDVVVVWRFDRFARGTSHLLRSL